MREIGADILYFEKFLDRDITNSLISLLDEHEEGMFNKDNHKVTFPFSELKGRLALYNFPNHLKEFNNFWFSNVEDMMLDYYFMFLDDKDTIPECKQVAKTEWKDIFLQVYKPSYFNSSNSIHIDFSGITFIACLDDDYEGGELNLPKQNVNIKLGARDIIIFPGNYTHPHGLSEVTSGKRRVLVGQSLGNRQRHKFGKPINNIV